MRRWAPGRALTFCHLLALVDELLGCERQIKLFDKGCGTLQLSFPQPILVAGGGPFLIVALDDDALNVANQTLCVDERAIQIEDNVGNHWHVHITHGGCRP